MKTSLFGALLALTSAISATPAGTARQVEETVPGVYIIQLHDGQRFGRRSGEYSHEAFARRALAESIDYNVRYEFKSPDLFYGLSVKVPNNESIAALEKLPQVAKVWPARVIPRPLAPIETVSEEALQGLVKKSDNSNIINSRQTTLSGLDYNVPHKTTGVDRLHARNIKGKGIKIAIIDSGVDWHHPALGGCFGAGCKISFGYDFVGDEYDGYNEPVPDNDPGIVCADGGHGTHVAGIIGMEVAPDAPKFANLTGVAPDAELGMYRVFGCSGGVSDDILLQSIAKAAEANPDIISMSIGAYSRFGTAPGDPYLQLISGLTERGIAVVVAAGNDGANEPFTISAPANSPKAIAVASIENTLFQVFEIEDSNGNIIKYGSLYPFPVDKALKVIVVGKGDEVAEFGCRAANYDPYLGYENKDDYVIVARRGICSLGIIQSAASTAGFRNVLTYPGSALVMSPFVDGYAAAIPAKDADGNSLNFGTTTTQKLFTEGKKSSNYTLYFKSAVPQLTRQAWGGQPNNFSSVGPVYDFTMKPQVSAPGGMILSTWPLSGTGFALASGTSMAAPYLAGAIALVKSQFPNYSVAELLARIQSTAKPVTKATRDDLSPPVQQGAGLVNAFDAIFYKSIVSPGQLELGPTERLAKNPPKITINNPTRNTIEYTLGHTLTPGMAKYPHWDAPNNQGYLKPSLMRLDSLDFGATVEFPAGSTFSLAPGESREVDIAIEPPQGLPDHTIPFYNGFVTVSSNNNEKYTIPYVGAAYNYTAAPVLGLDPVPSTFNFPAYPARGAPQIFYQSVGIGNHVQAPFTQLGLVASWLQALLYTRFDLVRAETDFVPTFYGFDPAVPVNYTKTTANTTGNIAGVDILGSNYVFLGTSPNMNLIDSFNLPPMWDGETGNTPLSMPVGGYRLLIQMLKLGGDPESRADWYTWMSGVIEIMEEIPAF